MKYFATFLLGILYTRYILCDDSLLADLIQHEVRKLAFAFPQGYDSLVFNLKAASEFLVLSIQHNELEATLKIQHRLPDEIVDKFQGIAFSHTVTIQSFILVLEKNTGHIDEYVGAAYNDEDIIKLAYIKVHSEGALIPQYVTLTKTNCETVFFFWTSCKDYNVTSTRGYTTTEVDAIAQTLRANGYVSLNEKISNIQSDSQFIILQEQKYYSMSKMNFCVLQSDGNFVIYHSNEYGDTDPIWATNTTNYPESMAGPYSLHIKNNGNVEIVGKDPTKLLWSSLTGFNGQPPHSLIMQEDGNLVLYDKFRMPMWDARMELNSIDFALPQNSLMFSPNGKFFAIVQKDGNFVVYSVSGKNGKQDNIPIWASKTHNQEQEPYNVILEKDGNLVLYGTNKYVVWQTNTKGHGLPPFTLELDNEGVLVIFSDYSRVPIWSSINGSLHLK